MTQHLTEMNKTLHNIEKFLARGSEAIRRGIPGGWPVPQTGLARVHQGEYVLSPSQVRTLSSGAASTGPMTLNMAVTVNASGMDRRSLEQTGDDHWENRPGGGLKTPQNGAGFR